VTCGVSAAINLRQRSCFTLPPIMIPGCNECTTLSSAAIHCPSMLAYMSRGLWPTCPSILFAFNAHIAPIRPQGACHWRLGDFSTARLHWSVTFWQPLLLLIMLFVRDRIRFPVVWMIKSCLSHAVVSNGCRISSLIIKGAWRHYCRIWIVVLAYDQANGFGPGRIRIYRRSTRWPISLRNFNLHLTVNRPLVDCGGESSRPFCLAVCTHFLLIFVRLCRPAHYVLCRVCVQCCFSALLFSSDTYITPRPDRGMLILQWPLSESLVCPFYI
jgi:hypothetical protein